MNLIEFPKGVELTKLKALDPTKGDYDNALIWSAELLKRGTPIPTIDLMISAISIRLRLQLVTRDKHFKHIKSAAKELNLVMKTQVRDIFSAKRNTNKLADR